nr:head maturation protease, ClpP-related [[Eubacterium] tenue]
MKNNKSNLNEFLKIKNITDNSADLYFYGDIVSDYYDSWDDTDQYPEQIIDFLNEVGDKNLNIYINSPGGNVFAGIAIYNMLKRHKGYKTVYVDGVAASIASVIAMIGDRIICPSNAYFMIHKPLLLTCGNANHLRERAETLDKLEEGILNIYQTKLQEGISIDTIKQLVNEETWLTGEDAVKYFDIEVSDKVNIIAKCDSDYFNKFTKVPKELGIEEYTDVIDKVENKSKSKEIANKNNELEKEKLLLELDLI